MAAKNTPLISAPLTRVSATLIRHHLLAILAGGVVAVAIYLLLDALNPVEEFRATAALVSALVVQFICLITLNRYTTQNKLIVIDNALENIARLGAVKENSSHSTGIDQKITHSFQALQAMQSASAQALLDTKLINVKLKHFDTVLNSLPFGVMVFDADAKIVFANLALSPMLCQESKNVLGKSLDDWCDVPELREYLHFRLLKKQHGVNAITISHPQRPSRWMHVEVRDMVDSQGKGHVASFHDATDAVQAQKARGEFVTSLSHELKTPLHTMNLYAEALRGPDGEDNEMRLEAANVIGDEIERIDSLIRNLLDATRIETGTLNLDRTRVRLPELLNDCLERIQANMEERQITLVSNIPNTMQAVFLDKTMFSVALNNLLSNAVKYNKDQGTLQVEMKETDEEVSITIADTGVGIPEKDLPFVFDKFYRASNVDKEGHGVGLSLAREIVQKHHGRLTVSSIEGQGTRFSLTLNKSAALTREAA